MPKEGDSKRLLPAAPKDESDRGHLRATILSAYDLPDNAQPSFVSLSLLGKDVQTGPPNARHRESNSFKFVSNEKEGSKNGESSGMFDCSFNIIACEHCWDRFMFLIRVSHIFVKR